MCWGGGSPPLSVLCNEENAQATLLSNPYTTECVHKNDLAQKFPDQPSKQTSPNVLPTETMPCTHETPKGGPLLPPWSPPVPLVLTF